MAKKTYNYNWTLKDAVFTKDKGKVFSCFACGGGSTMGYKLCWIQISEAFPGLRNNPPWLGHPSSPSYIYERRRGQTTSPTRKKN